MAQKCFYLSLDIGEPRKREQEINERIRDIGQLGLIVKQVIPLTYTQMNSVNFLTGVIFLTEESRTL